jgi:hypothetical protein
MSYSRYFCLFLYSGVKHILCCDFALFVFFLCVLYNAAMFSGFPFLVVALSVFSNVY